MIKLLWQYKRILGPLVLGLAVLFLFVWLRVVWVGQGKKVCEADQATAAMIAQSRALTTRERVENENRKLSPDGVDRLLYDNGWMRAPEDR